MKIKLLVLLFLSTFSVSAQVASQNIQDSLLIRQIFDEALSNGKSYDQLYFLCKSIGHRLTGSPQADEAIDWAKEEIEEYETTRIELQDVDATRWIRGAAEEVRISGTINRRLDACALGGSIGTKGELKAEIIEIKGIKNLENYTREDIEGKIVFFNEPMDPKLINTFSAYGACASQRYYGAVEAANYGAVAVFVRSLTTLTDEHPHTGSMSYKEGVEKIPAVAISTESAEFLHTDLQTSKVFGTLDLDCKTSEERALTHNLIGEIKGSENPENIIVFGAHIDSWDKGEGAHDDGAGVVQCMEVLRLLNEVGYKPKNTLRMVLYMNEENGNRGGHAYATAAKEANENHIFALETDRGGFSPRGFSIDGTSEQVEKIGVWSDLLKPYGLHYFEKGYGGVDIGPLKYKDNKINPKLILIGLYPDPQRYFDYHHSDDDIFENVNQRELELGGASLASLVYLLDMYAKDFE